MVISAVHETLAVVLVIEPASHPDNRRPAQLIFAVGRPRIVHDGFRVTDHHADEGDEPAVGRPCRAGGAFGQRADLKRIAPSQNVQDEDLVDGATAAVVTFAEDLPGLAASLTFRLYLPILTPGVDVDASGPNIATTQDLPYPLIAVLVTIIACVSAGFLLTKRRRR